MLIEFSSNIFQSVENLNKFNFLFNLCYLKRRYGVFIDITEVENTPLYNLLSENDKQVIYEYFNRQVNDSKVIDHCISNDAIDEASVFNLDEAEAFFNQPLGIILENSLNDKYFLEAMVKNFPGRSRNIKRHWDNRWIQIVNGGGCNNIENLIEEKLSTFGNLSMAPHSYLRLFVLIDSDSEFPGEEKPTRIKLKAYLEAKEIKYHFLYKREMENYLPEEVFEEIDENDDYITAYKKLTPVQKDFLDIQNGFMQAEIDIPFEKLKPQVQELFESISDIDKGIFRKERLKMTNFKSEFPKLFLKPSVTQATMKFRVSHQEGNVNELEDILDKINELL